MLHLPLLSVTIFLPLVGVLCLLFISSKSERGQNNARAVALLTSCAVLILTCFAYYFFDASRGDYQFQEKHLWISSLQSYYHVGVDGISLALMLLTAFITPLAILSTWKAVQHRVRDYMIAFLLLESFILGTFCALDLILFYLFFEAVLIPMYLIIGIWGGERRIYASFKFFLYTFLGSVLMLVAILVMQHHVGSTDLVAMTGTGAMFAETLQRWLWLAFFASFAVKMPMWPVHTWLPDAHVEAPTAGSVILAAILLKMGGYGFLRFSLPLFPDASLFFAPFVLWFSVIAIIITSLIALVQKDMKKLIAYSSIAHMGFVTAGLFSFSLLGLQGAVFQMISHGVISAALFLCIGVIYDRLHTRNIDRYGGVVHPMPLYATLFFLFILGNLGLPGTSGFVGEFLVMISVFQSHKIIALLMGLGIIFSAAYALYLFQRVIFGKAEKVEIQKLKDLTILEKMTLCPLAVAVVVLGIYPQVLLKLTEPSLHKYVSGSLSLSKETLNNTPNTLMNGTTEGLSATPPDAYRSMSLKTAGQII